MPCVPFENEAGFGFVCSDIGYEKEYNEYLTLLSQIKTKVKEDFAKS